MLNCIVFRKTLFSPPNGSEYWQGPEIEFNDFCSKNPDLDIFKVDTITTGKENFIEKIYLYYFDKSNSSDKECVVRNFKPGDSIIYIDEDSMFHGTVLATFQSNCLIRYDDGLKPREKLVKYHKLHK